MLNILPIAGWLLSLLVCMSLAVPFWVCYTLCGLGETYFLFLPEPWQSLPYWHTVGLMIVMSIVRAFTIPVYLPPVSKK